MIDAEVDKSLIEGAARIAIQPLTHEADFLGVADIGCQCENYPADVSTQPDSTG